MRFARIVAATACAFALLPPATSPAATSNVDIPGRYFRPLRVTISVGNTVHWSNSSNERHSITSFSSSKDQFTSSDNCPGGLLGFNDCVRPGGSYEHTFSRTGTFDYYCTIHGNENRYPNCAMCGRVTVRNRGGGQIAPTTPATVPSTPTVSSSSPSPTISGSTVTSPSATRPVAGRPPNGDGSSSLIAITALAVALLGGTGLVIYRTMIRR